MSLNSNDQNLRPVQAAALDALNTHFIFAPYVKINVKRLFTKYPIYFWPRDSEKVYHVINARSDKFCGIGSRAYSN
jgi:hypothetical protein